MREILAFDPDIVGFSIYVWSTPTLVAVAREIKRRRPGCVVVFGGPSARSALFDLNFYTRPGSYLDALVEGDGEVTFRTLAALPDLSRTFAGIGSRRDVTCERRMAAHPEALRTWAISIMCSPLLNSG